MVISAVTEFCAECCSSRALQGRGVSWGSRSVRTVKPVASLRHGNAVVLDRVTALLPRAVGSLEGHQPGGVEQEGVQVLSMDGPMERRLRATPLDFWQQVLNLLNGYQDLMKENQM